MDIRGRRYIKESSEWLVPWIPRLQTFDMYEALRFYRAVILKYDKNTLALLGCNDRFFLLWFLLGRKDVGAPWLYDRCREVEAEPDDFLDLWAREHYKSTIITFAGAIQEIMCDPEITIGVFAYTQDLAVAFVRQIKEELERNEILKDVYPDVLYGDPKSKTTGSPLWTNEMFVVRRTTNPKEATVEGWGLVQGQPTGRHFRLRIYDDVVTDKSVTNPEQVKRTTEAWELSDNLSGGEGRRWHVGTRYSFADTYGVIFERNILKPRLHPATDTGKIDGQPVFITKERWEQKKQTQRSTLAAQMLQNPLAGKENTFMPAWFRPYYVRPYTINVYLICDPSKGSNKGSDRTAIAVVAIDSQGNKFLVDGYRHRMTLSERWTAYRDLYWKWSNMKGVQFIKAGYERYGMQTDLEHFQEKMLQEGRSFPINEVSWTREGNESKKSRVERLEPDFRLSRFYLPALVHEPGLGTCYWKVDLERDHVVTTPLLKKVDGRIIGREQDRYTKSMVKAEAEGESWRIAKPIIRKDEDGRPYDVTRALMEEMLFFPFAPKDDLVDCVSRVYDLEPTTPALHEAHDPNEFAPPDA